MKLLFTHSEKHLKFDLSNFELQSYNTPGTIASPKRRPCSRIATWSKWLQTRHWIPEAKGRRRVFSFGAPFSLTAMVLTAALNVPIALGATFDLEAKIRDSRYPAYNSKIPSTIFPGVPQMLRCHCGFILECVNMALQQFAPASAAQLHCRLRFKKRLRSSTRGQLVEGYGLTEASPVTPRQPTQWPAQSRQHRYPPLPSTEARLVDLHTGKKRSPSGQIASWLCAAHK